MNELIKLTNGNLVADDAFMKIREVETLVEEMKAEEAHLAKRRKTYEDAIKSAKEFIKDYMLEQGLAEITGQVVKYSLVKSNPTLVIEDESLIPEEYKETTFQTKVRKDAIKDQLKMGDNIAGCKLEESFHVKVGVK